MLAVTPLTPLLLTSSRLFQLHNFARGFHMGASTLAAHVLLGFESASRINQSGIWSGLWYQQRNHTGPFCTSQPLSVEPWRCQMSRQARETEGLGVKGPPLSRPLVQHTSSNIYVMISYVAISGHENAHAATSHPRCSQPHVRVSRGR